MGGHDALVSDLKRLRKGRGVMRPRIGEAVGPELRRLCGVRHTDEPAAVRHKVMSWLSDATDRLPVEVRPAVAAAFALVPYTGCATLQERVTRLAVVLGKTERTARRRVDDVCDLVASAMADQPSPVPADDGWYVDEFRSLVRLDNDAPEVTEVRRIVATTPISCIEASVSLPRAVVGRATHDMHIAMLYGGRLHRRDRLSMSHFRYDIELATPLRRGQSHEYSVRLRIPPGQGMRTHYVFVPHRRCDQFEVRIRFGPARSPRALWRVDGLPIRVVDDAAPSGTLLSLDRVGEVIAQFRDLKLGLGYGIQWKM